MNNHFLNLKRIGYLAILLLSSTLSAKSPSENQAGLIVKDDYRTGLATAVLELRYTAASSTYAVMGRRSNVGTWYIGKAGDMKIGSFTTASRTAMVASIGTVVYDGNLHALYVKKNTGWAAVSSGGGGTTTASPTIATSNDALTISNNSAINSFTLNVRKERPVFNANKVQGTSWGNASPTAIRNLYFYSATQTQMLPLRIIGAGSTTVTLAADASSGTMTIRSTDTVGGSSGSGGSNVIPLLSVSPIGSATYNISSNTYILENNQLCGLDFSSINIPSNYASTTLKITFFARCATAPGAGTKAQFRLDYYTIASGTSAWTTGGYTSSSVGNYTIENKITYQKISSTTYAVPATGLRAGTPVFLRLWRVGTNAADTCEKDISIISAYMSF